MPSWPIHWRSGAKQRASSGPSQPVISPGTKHSGSEPVTLPKAAVRYPASRKVLNTDRRSDSCACA
eukprot:3672032-Prymnesium_polylepis.1